MAKKKKSSAIWKVAIVRLLGLPGYGLTFTAWVLLLGLIAVGVYVWMFGVVTVEHVPPAEEAGVVQAQAAEVVVMVVVGLAAWAGIAYFAGKIIRWVAGKFRINARHLSAFRLGMLSAGWLLMALAFAVVFPDEDYIVLLWSAFAIAAGSVSFGLEAALLRLWRLPPDTTW
jgi:hypothetical protein